MKNLSFCAKKTKLGNSSENRTEIKKHSINIFNISFGPFNAKFSHRPL